MADTLKILSIYEAVDGEANAWHQGTWSVFIRMAGCQVGCRWCDTVYSWPANRGMEYTVPELLGK
ncbi:MAG: 7-carboxy-7-deazaguanine synthase QueE, partial [Candidatus Saccharimonadales bacterium]